jgi:hypothetical protein
MQIIYRYILRYNYYNYNYYIKEMGSNTDENSQDINNPKLL